MKKPTTITSESVSEYREFVQLRLRKQVLEAIGIVIDEELDQALGCGAYERSEERRGYRNGGETRRVTTAMGTRGIRVPRARLRDEQTGETKEFRSQLLPRYQRRTREVDEAILATYLSGANSRRIRKALKPLLGDDHLSKSAVSRMVSRLKERFEEGKPHAACDVAGAGNGLTVRLVRHSHRKRGETDRPRLRSTAPALDPTDIAARLRSFFRLSSHRLAVVWHVVEMPLRLLQGCCTHGHGCLRSRANRTYI